MTKVSTRTLKDQLSSYLHRAERGEQIIVLRGGKPVAALVSLESMAASDEPGRLAALAHQGLLTLPADGGSGKMAAPEVPSRGQSAASMVLEDRR
ncbi:MAG: type II toxin-antitoxin system prevent-host-death family antitoxin [Acidobacteriota bacterium]|nr:type II toxin-antitoxin system prevent-host-death family antitoxin [Acidobacteriota bacterium]